MYSIFEKNNIINNNGESFLLEFSYFYNYDEKISTPILNKFAIWFDEINISHISKSQHLSIDSTWYKHYGFEQIIIILDKDIIINEKIPWLLYNYKQ